MFDVVAYDLDRYLTSCEAAEERDRERERIEEQYADDVAALADALDWEEAANYDEGPCWPDCDHD